LVLVLQLFATLNTHFMVFLARLYVLLCLTCMLERSTIEAIFLIRQVMEQYRDYREQNKDLHMVFIGL
jgi:protein-S-isoprenylcysteine O-methyltransferase Ste14